MVKINTKEMIEQVRANMALLESCGGPHRFEEFEDEMIYHRRLKCSLCGGIVYRIHYVWYERGLKHGEGGDR